MEQQQIEMMTAFAGEPWAQSERTSIWNITREISAQAAHGEPQMCEAERATLGVYLVYAPWMHPMFPWHYVGLVHLRELQGAPPAYRDHPSSTHEFVAATLDPRATVVDGSQLTLTFLHPPDITEQFAAARDAEALDLVERALRECVAGRLSLDQDFRRSWHTILRHGCAAIPRRALVS